MSRCFPFPPPGYEKKPRSDDADLLKKEKHKEKKKKDKKDKEKKEGKEKREKDRSDGKNREKKDRKEKHGEKKKDKEKDRDREKGKDKSNTSEEKRVGEQVEGYNGEKIYPRELLDKEKKISSSDEKKATIQFSGQQGEKPVQRSILVKETEDPKFVQELGRRIREIEKGAGSSQLVDRFSVLEWKKDDPAGRFAVEDIRMVSEGKNKDKKADAKKMDGDEARFAGSMVVENHAEIAQDKIEGPTIPSDKKTERKIEETNKSRNKENNDKRGDKRKKKDRDKKSHGEKEKKKEEKAKEKSEHKKTEKDKTKHSSKNDIVCAPSDKSTHLPYNGAETSAKEENFKKRKTAETNGFSHEDEPWPKKMPRQASSSNISTQNGKKLDPSNQSPGLFPLDRQRQNQVAMASPNNPGLFPLDRQRQNQVAMASPNNLKEQKINGIISSPPLSLPKPKPSSSSSTFISVSTLKPLSETANELSALVGLVSTTKALSETANEIAIPLMSVSTAKPPSATSVTSISATKQPSPPDIGAVKRASVSSSKKPSSSSATNNQVAKPSSSMKPPHPDCKFLSQILTVPKMEDVSDLDDQEWLFSGKDRLLKKPNMDSDGVDEEAPQVWAEALRLESVDIFALPYVVPY